MLIIAITFIRPSNSVPFFALPDELKTQFINTYRYTGKSPETSNEISADGLTSVVTTKWRRRADFDEYIADPLSTTIRDLRVAYQIETGIQSTTNIEFVPSFDDFGEGYVAPEVQPT